MDGVIKAHCMGMEFPKRDTDGPNVKWALPTSVADIMRDAQNHLLRHYVGGEPLGTWLYESGDGQAFRILAGWRSASLPSAADLDAVAEEQRVKEKPGAQIPNR